MVRKSEVNGEVKAPPSKSYTHRALFAGALSRRARIYSPLISDDTLATAFSCKKSGSIFLRKGDAAIVGGLRKFGGYYNCMNSGTTLRILISLAAALGDHSILDGDESLRNRPNKELCEAVKKLGAEVIGGEEFKAPLKIRGRIKAGEVEISGKSSQFVTSLLFALPLVGDSVVRVRDLKSKPYVDVTLHVLEESNVKVEVEGNEYHVYDSEYKLREFQVPPDFSSISYLIAAGVVGGKVSIKNVVDSRQGDKVIVDLVREMGGRVEWRNDEIVAEKSELEGIEFDASNNPDLVPTIAVLAAVAKGKTRIYNAEHLRLKETDRITTICENLRRLGVDVKCGEGEIVVEGKGFREFKGVVDSFGDHRIAMAFSVLGLLGEVRILKAECVSVSYPKFFQDLKKLGADVNAG
ncbi:3-phosphoshikimate 1-carboxyvinyltransferase [Ferroglobus placidus DSM 10642]|uniref:3-phosphoshikimate 1-carboxyvinyltransferase n=1 Tax=Ferroglobus placidus (strain DSM 10642 / AEDII12DO) TaxID=589924 RepID=D3RZX5_FERPA|nr:3-phosphoshikimate 1-carboxyvinyltransferase [Ferroglobus placidus DSM 10642]